MCCWTGSARLGSGPGLQDAAAGPGQSGAAVLVLYVELGSGLRRQVRIYGTS